ncbi:MAG: twin-arginine translocase subunit TatB [Hyphomicrobiales bacterium]|nr:twin-arginine translocase subunit TatB [Hyphomicrobiales bacterium]
MFDFDVGKIVIVGVVALIVVGPKDLPRVLRQVGQIVGKMRRMATEFQNQFMEAMREADVEDLKKHLEKATDAVKLDSAFDPLRDAHKDIVKAIETDPTAAAALATAEPLSASPDPVAPAIEAPAPAGENALEPPAPQIPHVEAAAQEPSPGTIHDPAARPPLETAPHDEVLDAKP